MDFTIFVLKSNNLNTIGWSVVNKLIIKLFKINL